MPPATGALSDPKREVANTPAPASAPTGSEEPSAAKMAFDAVDTAKSGSIPIEQFEDVLEQLGEGFHGDDLDEQRSLADPDGTGMLTRARFVQWYDAFVADGDEDEEADDEEIAEERQNATEAFETVDSGECGSVGPAQFSSLFEALGTTYCEEEHAAYMNKLSGSDGRVLKEDFVEWYIDWLFGDNDEDRGDDPGDDGDVLSASSPDGKDAGAAKGFDKGFGQLQSDQWKCPICAVPNDAAAAKCSCCGEPNPSKPAAPKGAAPAAGGAFGAPAASSTSGAISAKGFTFGGGGGESSAPSAVPAASSTSGAISARGFTFGGVGGGISAPSAVPVAFSTSGAISAKGFSFGGASPAAPAASTGFSFGSATPAAPAVATQPATATAIGATGFTYVSPAKSSGAAAGSVSTQDVTPTLTPRAPTDKTASPHKAASLDLSAACALTDLGGGNQPPSSPVIPDASASPEQGGKPDLESKIRLSCAKVSVLYLSVTRFAGARPDIPVHLSCRSVNGGWRTIARGVRGRIAHDKTIAEEGGTTTLVHVATVP